jgi:hypothetical protein
MSDLVGTCPKDFWEEWIAEGDAAGTPATGMQYNWGTASPLAGKMCEGDRFYVVAHGKLRGYALVTQVLVYPWQDAGEVNRKSYAIVRAGGAVACTIPEHIPGFRGLRLRWWKREEEVPFPDWKRP